MWRTKSLTATESVMSWVSVPLQRSAIVHLVPRTVAAAYLPLVLNLPFALAWRSCRVLLAAALAVTSPALPLHLAKDGAPLNAFSTRLRVASPLCAWATLKIAPPNVPLCVLTLPFALRPFLPLAAASAAG